MAKTKKQIQSQEKNKKKKIAIAVPLSIVGLGGVAAAIAIPLCLRNPVQEDVIPYEAYVIGEGIPAHHPIDSTPCKILYGFDSKWLSKNDITKYKIMQIPAYVDYIQPSAFWAQDPDGGEFKTTIPENIIELKFEARTTNDDTYLLGLAENCFREAPFKTIQLPRHLGGSYSLANMNVDPSVRDEGAFRGCPNVETLDLREIDVEAATILMDKLDYNTFLNWPQVGVIIFNDDLATEICDGLKTTLYNVGLETGWFGGVTPRATTVKMDENNIVTGFADIATPDLVALELYAYDNSGILRMPAGAKGIAENAFKNWGGLESIKSVIKGISFADWDDNCVIESIGNNAFKGCEFSQNTIIEFPQSITSIGDSAFAGITSLSEVKFAVVADDVTRTVGKYAFEGDVNLKLPTFTGTGIKTISEGMFSGCIGLQKEGVLPIEPSILSIETNAFDDCSITSLLLSPSSNLTIHSNAFRNNEIKELSLQSVSDPNKIQLEENALPSHLTDEGQIISYTASNILDQWRWENAVNKIFNNAKISGWKVVNPVTNLYALLYDVQYDEGTGAWFINGFNSQLTANELLDLIIEIEQPEDPNFITLKFPKVINVDGQDRTIKAFANFGSKDVQTAFPSNIVGLDFSEFGTEDEISIKQYAFYNIDSIKSINNLEVVQTIEDSAFAYCDAITSIKLRQGVVIGNNAFKSCTKLVKIDIEHWTQSWIEDNMLAGSWPIGKNCFGGVAEDGWLVLPDLAEGLSGQVSQFFINPDGAALPNSWGGGVSVIIEPQSKTIQTKAAQKTGQLIYEIAPAAQQYPLNWKIEFIPKDSSTTNEVSYTIDRETEPGDKQLVIDLKFLSENLVNGDHYDFDVKIYGKSVLYKIDGTVTFEGYSFVYTGTISPHDENGVILNTDIFSSTKDFQFDVHDWEIKTLDNLNIDFEFNPIGSNTDVTASLLTDKISLTNKLLTLPIQLTKSGDGILDNGDKACFKITVSRVLAGVEWTKTWDNCSLTYQGYVISSDQAGKTTNTDNNKDYGQFTFKATDALLPSSGYEYYALVKNIIIQRDADNISLYTFDDQGQPKTQLFQNAEINLGTHKDIYLKLGLVVSASASQSQIIANDKVAFELEYGFKKSGGDFTSIGKTEKFALQVANSMIGIATGGESKITTAGGRQVTYHFDFTKPWIANTDLKMDITGISGSFTPVFTNGLSSQTITPSVGSTGLDVPVVINDISQLTDESTSNFGITFTALQNKTTTLWSKEISPLSMKYLSPRLTIVKKDKLVAIGAQVPYVVYEFDIANENDNLFDVTLIREGGSLNPSLSSKEVYAQGKKLYVRVNFPDQTIDSESTCALTLSITSKNLGWTQVVESLTVKSMNNFSDIGPQKSQYNAWTGQFNLNMQQALETSQHEEIKITDFKIAETGTDDVSLSIDQKATSTVTNASFGYTIGSVSGKSITAIDRDASNYWVSFSCKIQVVNGNTTIYEQTLTGLKVTLSGVPIYSGYRDHASIASGTQTRNIPFDVAENFQVGTSYWVVKWVETESGNTKVNENATVLSITGNTLTLQIKFDSTGFIMHNSTEGYFVFYYYGNGDAQSGGTPTWTFTTTGDAFKYW